MTFPQEVVDRVLLFSHSTVDFALGQSPNAKKLFIDGGYCNVLKQILETDADIKSIYYIKSHIPELLALLLALDTKADWIVKRVCILWNIWTSDSAFVVAWQGQFVWGTRHIKPISTLTPQMYNRVYFELGLLDQIDLTVKKPFKHIYSETNDYLKAKYLHFKPVSDTFDKDGLLWLYLINGEREKVYELIGQDVHRKLQLAEDICYSLSRDQHKYLVETNQEEKLEYKLPIDLYREYKEDYNVDKEELLESMTKLRRVEVWKYFADECAEIHIAILTKDATALNEFLICQRETALRILTKYGLNQQQYQDILVNSDVKLDSQGKWLGLPEGSPRVDDNGYDITYVNWGQWSKNGTINEAMIRDMKTEDIEDMLSESLYRFKSIPRIILLYLQFNGKELLDNIHSRIPLASYFVDFSLETVMKLIEIALERNYSLNRLETCPDEDDPQVYIQDRAIYFEDHLIELETPYSLDTDKIIQNQIIIACRTYFNAINANIAIEY